MTLTLPAASERYATTCASPLSIAIGTTTATCTITAAPNTDTEDGNAVATLSLLNSADYAMPKSVATVTIKNDDFTPVPTLGHWGLLMLSGLLAALTGRRRRTH